MTRVEFLTELDRQLSALSKEEADRHLAYYAEMLADRMEDGMSEEEAVASMESVDVIARRILGAAYTTPKKKGFAGKALIIAAFAVFAVFLVLIGIVSKVSYLFSVNWAGTGEIDITPNEAFAELPIVDYGDEYTTCIDPQGITSLDVSWTSGAVYFEIWDEPEIGVCEHGQETVPCESSGGTLYIGHYTNLFEASTGDLTIFLPRDVAENLLDEIRISVASADVTLKGLNVRSLTLSTVSGEIQAVGRFGEVSVSTASGGVSLYGSMESVMMDSVSGELFLHCDEMLRSLEADTISGSVTLTVPADFGFSLEFDSVSGSVFSDFFDISGKVEKFTHGSGGAELRVDTVSGRLNLERE